MRIFWREIKYYKKSLFFWCLAMTVFVWSSMVKYGTFETAGQSITEMVAMFPQSVQAIFGMVGFDLTKASGFFGVMYMYIALIATIHAVMLGAGILSKEERDKTTEFLLVKPISRISVLTQKISAGLVNVILFNIFTLLCSLFFVDMYNGDEPIGNEIALMLIGILFMQAIFFFFGILMASVSRRPKLSVSIASGVLLMTFIITYLVNFNSDFDFLKFFSPFLYFEAKDIIADNTLKPVFIALSSTIIFVSAIFSYITYRVRDMNV